MRSKVVADDDDLKRDRVENSDLRHDMMNHVGAAKMSAELMGRSQLLPPGMRGHVDRILSNLLQLERLIEGAQVAGRPSPGPTSPHPAVTRAEKKSVLLIDDSADLRALFFAVLKPRGYAVSAAKDDKEAMAALAQGELPDLILLDYTLGDLTGSEVLDAIEKVRGDALRHAKIVLYTAYGDRVGDARVHAVEPKAMAIDALVDLVQRHLR